MDKTIKVSYLPINQINRNHINLEKVDLFELLSYYKNLDWSDEDKLNYKKKRLSGAIYAFYDDKKLIASEDKFNGNGLVLIDIDKSKEFADEIISKFNVIASKYYYNIIAITKSASGNIHVISYDPQLESEDISDIYSKIATIHLACFSEAVKKATGIDLSEVEGALDLHSTKVSQMFYMTKTDFKFNEYFRMAASLNNDTLYKKVKKVYPSLFKQLEIAEKYKNLDESLKTDKSNFKYVFKDFIDSNVNHIAHTERMYLYSSLMFLFEGEELKNNWIRCCHLIPSGKHDLNYYLNEPYKNHWTKHSCHMSLLKMFGYDVEKQLLEVQIEQKFINDREIWHPTTKENVFEIEDGKYLSDYIELLRSEINENSELVIKGNTGIGKTRAISLLAKELNGIVLVPFLSLRNNYEDNLIILDTNDYSRAIPTCMVYDRFAMIDYRKFEGKTIFIDESHISFKDRDYRERLVSLNIILKRLVNELNCHIVYVSATPLKEAEGVKRLEFVKPRPFVNVKVYKVKNTYDTINKMIGSMEWRNKYNRMLIFSDTNARKFKDNHMYMSQQQLSIIHSDYNWTGDLDRIKNSSLLDSDVTIATSLAFNGLNFNNEDEKVLIVSELDHQSTAWSIIQQCGRMRKSVVDLRIIVPDTESKANTVDYKRNKAESYASFDNIVYDTDNSLLNDDIYKANKEIEDYTNENKGIDNILNALREEGYFLIDDEVTYSDVTCKVSNVMRKKADKLSRLDEMIEEFENGNLQNYYNEFLNAKNQLLSIADKEMVYKLMNEVMNRMVNTMCSDILKCNTISNYSDDEWEHLNQRVDNAIKQWNSKDRILARDMAKDKKKNNQLRKEYKDCKNGNEVIDKYINLYLITQKEASKKMSMKKNQSIKIYNTVTKKTYDFDSLEKAGKKLNLSLYQLKVLKTKKTYKVYKVL